MNTEIVTMFFLYIYKPNGVKLIWRKGANDCELRPGENYPKGLLQNFCFYLSIDETLPVNLPNSSKISSLPFDFGMFPTKRRRFGTLMLIFRFFPGLIS